MGMEFYGDSYKGNDEPIFVGIPTNIGSSFPLYESP